MSKFKITKMSALKVWTLLVAIILCYLLLRISTGYFDTNSITNVITLLIVEIIFAISLILLMYFESKKYERYR